MDIDDVTVVGIDVGATPKGFHAIALRGDRFVDKIATTEPSEIVAWCIQNNAKVVAVDAPCKWSQAGASRLAERELNKKGINCFATPSRNRALNHTFYKWMFNGERLYKDLEKYYHLFDGGKEKDLICIETFPHAIVCAIAGRVISAKPKAQVRRNALQVRRYDPDGLSNIDFVDAALCAVTADDFRIDNYNAYGDYAEGFIVVGKRKT